jgi:hypothetical protein
VGMLSCLVSVWSLCVWVCMVVFFSYSFAYTLGGSTVGATENSAEASCCHAIAGPGGI